MANKSGDSRYQRQLKGKQGQSSVRLQGQTERKIMGTRESQEKTQQRIDGDKIDSVFGFDRLKEGLPRLGWLLNYLPISMPDESGLEKSGMDLYFIDREGGSFKASVFFAPYFFIDFCDQRRSLELSQHLLKKFEGCTISVVEKEDLDMANHLSGKKHKFLKIEFRTVSDMQDAKSVLRPLVMENQKRIAASDDFVDNDAFGDLTQNAGSAKGQDLPTSLIVDLREHDLPYPMRVSIDLELRVGCWFVVAPQYGSEVCTISWQKDLLELCEPRILAFDIECEKSPLKFPNPENDRIFMISYMAEAQGYLLINREVVSEDIQDFEYTPKPHYPGPFTVVNLEDEEAVLKYFLQHIQQLRPHVFVTYNGDKFDWPYVEIRCSKYPTIGSLYSQLGIKAAAPAGPQQRTKQFKPQQQGGEVEDVAPATGAALFSDGEYTGRCIVHLDAFSWVQRDSYLPQGTQGLKAVTKNKLGYDPVEVDPEDMLRFARERPHHMASYSVSDAVATYYLYTTYVHNFIFSLSTIIPLASEDVLRKGSGTLCEALLMVEAFRGNIVCPNKQVDPLESFHEGHLLESETYIGGHVECLEAGVFRADIPAKFSLVPSALQQLIDHIDRDLTFTLEVEHGLQRSDVTNYDEVRQAIVSKLELLRDNPLREESPIIYHLDVGAMYPNIILTNRLQPAAIVQTSDCAACEFNRSENQCKRPMNWTWRGEYSPASKSEYNSVKNQLAYEKVAVAGDAVSRPYVELSEKEQLVVAKARLKGYANRVYKKTKVTSIKERTSTVCMRENSFYVDTVKAFRDRRYDYKLLTKTWKTKKAAFEKAGDLVNRKVAEDREVLMDSLQLAHKCILNSFYGYVMRKGARWRSMEMAGIVTHTGALLIKQARELVEQVGRPLELDTDGIWCILPASFPQDFKFKTQSSGNVSVGYPCAMLNADVHERYTNHQYQDLSSSSTSSSKRFDTHSECSIFFELDGPYKAMVLPASPEEGKLLKKKYVVFNFNGSIAELKGFELKRRGELELVKIFQSLVFDQFLSGANLQECYAAVGAVGNQWLDVLDQRGENMADAELLELISERKTISKTVDDYGDRKSTSLTTAGRLADFLGADMVKDKGLNCNLIISRLPAGAPVTERAIPVAIFSCEESVKKFFLRKWLKDNTLDCEDFRDVVDWQYYKERLGKTIQKIITIPAGIQRIPNPCPRVEHPVWLARSISDKASGMRQLTMKASFLMAANQKNASLPGAKLLASQPVPEKRSVTFHSPSKPGASKKRGLLEDAATDVMDLEDIGGSEAASALRGVPVAHNFRGSASSSSCAAVDAEREAEEAVEEVSAGLANIVLPMHAHKPQSHEELDNWLENRKAHWKRLREQRKANKGVMTTGRVYGNPYRSGNNSSRYSNTTTTGGVLASKKAIGMMDYMRSAQLAITQHCWQVLELQETDVPGEFKVWALTTPTQLQCITMVVHRTLYVNVVGADAQRAARELGGVEVKRDLPHSKSGCVLFEISIPEHKYLSNEKALNLFLSNAQVEGVYESQVPLYHRAILQLGCVARCVNEHAQFASKFRLTDMELVHVQSFPYLERDVASFKRLFLYCANNANSNGQLGVLALFVVDSSNVEEEGVFAAAQSRERFANVHEMPLSAKAFVWLVNGRGAATLDSVPPLQRIYRKFQNSDVAAVKFTTSYATTMADAYALCNEKLRAHQRERHGPTVVVAQGGAMGCKDWRYQVPMLHEYPVTVVPTNNSDNVYPAVGWQHFTCERLVQRFLIFPNWFGDRLRGARYAHIPVCNLGTDALTTIIDVVFSRQLVHNRHLLWCSEGNNTPDLGDSANSGSGHSVLVEFDGTADSTPTDVLINNSGVYRDICIELDVYGLAVCSVMSSGELDAEGLTALNISTAAAAGEHRGASEIAVADDEIGQADEADRLGAQQDNHMLPSTSFVSSDASCARAFNIFKAMVAKCLEEVERRHDPISDAILTALYRYLCGYGNGLLSDPALHRVVYNLMTQLFKKLVAGLKRLGTRIVYADFGRIIVATNKRDWAAAQEYIAFVTEALMQREVFSLVQISIKGHWEQLVWLGPENFSGIRLEEEPVGLGGNGEATMAQELVDLSAEAERRDPPAADVAAETAEGSFAEADTQLYDAVDENSEGEGETEVAAEEVVVAPVKLVKIASIFAKKGAAPSESVMAVADTPAGQNASVGAVKHHLNNLKSTTASSKSSEYDFLGELGGEAGSTNLNSIKNTFRSATGSGSASKKIKSGRKTKGGVSTKQQRHHGDSDSEASSEQWSDGEEQQHWLRDQEEDLFLPAAPEQEEEDTGGVESHWNLSTYYPQAVAEYFKFVVSEFLLKHQQRRDELLEERQERQLNGSQLSQHRLEEAAQALDDESISAAVTEHMRHEVGHWFTDKMLQLVDAIQHENNEGFPLRAGSHLALTTPALEFVKSTTHVMGLDGSLREEVATLKRMLLAQLRVREFSAESQFRDPCLSFVLRDVICGFCSTCRDMDLLRNATLTSEDRTVRWLCGHCGNAISEEEVENRLLDETDKMAATYLLQDLRCAKTHRVAQRLCTGISDLCEPLVMDVKQSDLRAKLGVMLKVAQFHEFTFLETAVQDLLSSY